MSKRSRADTAPSLGENSLGAFAATLARLHSHVTDWLGRVSSEPDD
jgi:hypothetical protein